MEYRNLTIIGTSHIARESVEQVKDFILKNNPNIIAIELDKKRLYALMSERATGKKEKLGLGAIRQIGLKGYLFSLIGAWAEEKLGKSVGIKPGTEMVTAIILARKTGAELALIDQDIEVTLKRFSKGFTWKEKGSLVSDIFMGLFFPKRQLKKLGLKSLDLSKVPGDKLIARMMKEVKHRYPNFYRVLVVERNIYMARNLAMIMHDNPEKSILAVVGAGHEAEIISLVKKELSRKEHPISYSYTVSCM